MKKYNRIKEELKNQDRKVPWLAKMAGLDENTVYNYSRNDRQPKLDTLAKIAKVLGVKASSLVVDQEENSGL